MKSHCSNALKGVALALPLLTGAHALAADRAAVDKPFQLAQAQPQEDPAARKRREEEQKRRQPPPAGQQQPPQQQQRRPDGQPPRAQRPEGTPPGSQRNQRQIGNQQQQPGNQQQPGSQPGSQRNQRQIGSQPPQPAQQPSANSTQQPPPGRQRLPSRGQTPPNQSANQGTPPTTPPPTQGQPPAKRGQPSILNPNANQPAPSTRTTTPTVVPNTPPVQPQQQQQQAPRSVEGRPVLPPGAGTNVPAPLVPGQRPPAVPGLQQPLATSQRANIAPPRFDQVQQKRETRVEAGGKRTVITEGNNRTIIKQDNRVFIRHDESERFKRIQNSRSISLANGGSQTFYVRPDGFRVVSETDRNGGLIRRYRRGPDGREFNIIDNRRFWRNAAIGIGVGVIAAAVIVNLRSPTVTIPRERYIVDYGRADDELLFEALSAPPIERPERVYSLEEVRYNYPLREHMRSIDLDDINFEFGAFEVTPDQYGKLERLAKLINRVIEKNADEVFMIEGHTDAVGSDVDNLSLSDRRAQSVAQILSERFGIPPENLVTQGYGEQFLKVKTQEAERTNRRVTVRRITPLIAEKG